MIVYHGTTRRRAQRICRDGFRPRKPSRRVWFARSRAYAERRARTQARRAHDRPVVLTCDINLDQWRDRLGAKRVVHRGGVVAIDGPVPVSVLRSHVGLDQPTSPGELAVWANRVLGLKPHRGVSPRHPGIERLSRWVERRLIHQPGSRITDEELLHLARQWLPEFFRGVEIDLKRLHVHRGVATIDVQANAPAPMDPREEEALECLDASSARRRVRGLTSLADLGDPDLFDWCAMLLGDTSREVLVAALRTMRRCEDVEAEVVASLAGSRDKRIRAAAIAVLARHGGRDALRWFKRGLKDPSACVRMETAALLPTLDPTEHHAVFDLALYDPNSQVARLARKLTAGKGYAEAAR